MGKIFQIQNDNTLPQQLGRTRKCSVGISNLSIRVSYLRWEILLEQLRRYVSVGRVIAEVRLQAECHQRQYVLVVAVFRGAAPVRDIFAQLKVIVLPGDVIAAKHIRV